MLIPVRGKEKARVYKVGSQWEKALSIKTILFLKTQKLNVLNDKVGGREKSKDACESGENCSREEKRNSTTR